VGISFSGVGGPAKAPRRILDSLGSFGFDMADHPEKTLAEILAENYPPIKTWCWDWKFHKNLQDHMHAIGVISVNYNDLELVLYFMFHFFLNDYQSRVPPLLFAQLSNERRLNYMGEFSKSYHSGRQKQVIDCFLEGFGVCAWNRNILMHSSMPEAQNIADAADPAVVLNKRSHGSYSSISRIENITVTRLRQIADEIAAYEGLGWKLYVFLLAQRSGGGKIMIGSEIEQPTLPEILTLPEKLILPGPEGPIAG
jgi:hypothetical protein